MPHGEVGLGVVVEERSSGVCGGWPIAAEERNGIRPVALGVLVRGVPDAIRTVAERSHGRQPDPGRRCTKPVCDESQQDVDNYLQRRNALVAYRITNSLEEGVAAAFALAGHP